MSSRRMILWALLLLQMPALPVMAETCGKCKPVAEVEGEAITSQEVEKVLGVQLAKLEEQAYAMKQQALDGLIDERLLTREAAKRGVSVQAILESEVAAKTLPVSQQEIDTFYQKNRSSLEGQESDLRRQIGDYLQNQKRIARWKDYVQALRSQAKVSLYLQALPAFRAEVGVEGAPSQGPVKAPVTIVEFSDFHCPYCKQAQTTLADLLSRYGPKVKLVYRNFPIDSLHPGARKAAEAAQCANEQGKFWPYHDKLYAAEADASPKKLGMLAEEVGLDVSTFEACLSNNKYQTTVEKDIQEITRLGVTETPAFFVNGRLLLGTQPVDSFIRAIDEELALVK